MMQNEAEGIGSGVSSATGVGLQSAQIAANVGVANAQAYQLNSQTALNKALAEEALAKAGYTTQSARSAKVEADVAETAAPAKGALSWVQSLVQALRGK